MPVVLHVQMFGCLSGCWGVRRYEMKGTMQQADLTLGTPGLEEELAD